MPTFYTCDEGLSALTQEGQATLERLEGMLAQSAAQQFHMAGVRTEDNKADFEGRRRALNVVVVVVVGLLNRIVRAQVQTEFVCCGLRERCFRSGSGATVTGSSSNEEQRVDPGFSSLVAKKSCSPCSINKAFFFFCASS